jgi:hypothetical protein
MRDSSCVRGTEGKRKRQEAFWSWNNFMSFRWLQQSSKDQYRKWEGRMQIYTTVDIGTSQDKLVGCVVSKPELMSRTEMQKTSICRMGP